MPSTLTLEAKTPILEEQCAFLGTAEFRHSNSSGWEAVSFYRDEQGQIYHAVNFVDPFDYSSAHQKLRLCTLPGKEVERLLGEKKVCDYRRFYWD